MPEPTDPQLRDRLVAALQAAAYDCDGDCGVTERECDAAHPIQVAVLHFDQIADITGSVDAIAEAMAAVVQPLLDAKDTEIAGLRTEVETYRQQPVLRHCVYPTCLHEFDMAASAEGRPTRPSWSSKGWLQSSALLGHICPDHAAIVRDVHEPRWLTTGKYLVCACGWESPPVRWRGYGIEAWKDHLLPEAAPQKRAHSCDNCDGIDPGSCPFTREP